jgi:hypothetical protein
MEGYQKCEEVCQHTRQILSKCGINTCRQELETGMSAWIPKFSYLNSVIRRFIPKASRRIALSKLSCSISKLGSGV